jgi:hypothetical protein
VLGNAKNICTNDCIIWIICRFFCGDTSNLDGRAEALFRIQAFWASGFSYKELHIYTLRPEVSPVELTSGLAFGNRGTFTPPTIYGRSQHRRLTYEHAIFSYRRMGDNRSA